MYSRNLSHRQPAGFTLVEIMVALGGFGILAAALMTAWTGLQAASVNANRYAQRQNDQMRILDYLKRDIRRASKVEIYNGNTLVTGTATGNELRVTVADYYADAREEDNAHGSKVANAPTYSGGLVSYGATLLVRYYLRNGAVVRDEGGVVRSIADADGAFTLTFNADPSGAIKSRLAYSQTMGGWNGRKLKRQVDVLVMQHSLL